MNDPRQDPPGPAGSPGARIAERLGAVRERIAAACLRAGRDPASVGIVAVTKRHPAAVVAAASRAGLRDVGENYAQELRDKRAELGAAADAVRWHFIGRLQKNKVKYVVGHAARIHAVDSLDLARAIDRHAGKVGVQQRVLIAVNVAGEVGKSGVPAAAVGELVAAIARLDHVVCAGFMTMPPWVDDAEDNREHFRALARLARDAIGPGAPDPELSMGTTGDYAVAVEEGATWVRVGTALFGPRPP